MYMTPAITVAILAFAVGLQAQPLNYDDAAITARSAQPEAYPEAYPDAYADAELEARMNSHVGDFVKGAVGGMAANAVANHYGHGTSNMNAALMGGVGNAALHSQHLHDAAHRILGRDAEAEAYPDAYADAELEARMNGHVGDFVKGAVGGMAANAVANHYGHGTSNTNAALMGGAANIAAHSEHLQHAGQRLSNSLQRLIQRDTEAVLYQLAIQRRSQLRNALQY